MTQSSMFAEFRVYTIDADCINGLDDAHDVLDGYTPPPPKYNKAERLAASDGRLKIVLAVRQEIGRRNRDGRRRLQQFPRTVVRTNNLIRENYQMLIEQYPDWAPRGISRFEQGDPWMVAFAMDRGWGVLSDEKKKDEQRKPKKNRNKVPDVCKVHSIPCYKLKNFAETEGWI